MPAATKTLRVLELVATERQRTLGELMTLTSLPKSTLLRILATLLSEGYITRVGAGVYRPALKLWRLGCNAVVLEDLREQVGPFLNALVDKTQETALYAVYEAGRAVYTDKVDGANPVRAYVSLGSSSPAYATASGKALLAWQSDREIRSVLAGATKLTDTTIDTYEAFAGEAEEIRSNGYSLNRGEWRAEVGGIAAPVHNRDKVVAAIGISGPLERVLRNFDSYRDLVANAAADLTEIYGRIG